MLPELGGADIAGPAKGPEGGLADPDGSPEPPQDPPLPRSGLMLIHYENHFPLKMINYLDTLASAQEVLHMDQDIQDLAMALAAVQEDRLRELMHWEVQLVWTLEDHRDTCFHQSLEEALALQGFHLRYIPENLSIEKLQATANNLS